MFLRFSLWIPIRLEELCDSIGNIPLEIFVHLHEKRQPQLAELGKSLGGMYPPRKFHSIAPEEWWWTEEDFFPIGAR